MKVVLINKSDSTGGAAVVTFRLMKAMRAAGIDARMLVAEKLTDSPYVELAAPRWMLRQAFLRERLTVLAANGMKRDTLFRIDNGACGVPLWRHPWIREADAVIINWINQGMLSLRGVKKLLASGKRVLWTMHDMWCMTGVCHHAASCRRYADGGQCGDCPLLADKANPDDLSHRVWLKKNKIYTHPYRSGLEPVFVAVSHWLADKAAQSSLLSARQVEVIPNVFSIDESLPLRGNKSPYERIEVVMGAARLDDPIKGFPTLISAMKALKVKDPAVFSRVRLSLFGTIRDYSLLEEIVADHRYLGRISPAEDCRLLHRSDIVVSTSDYETLPGTLVEGQAYGSVPVAFDSGGQRDIIDDGLTGFLAERTLFREESASNIAEGIIRAARALETDGAAIRQRMRQAVERKFSIDTVTGAYMRLIEATGRKN